MIEQKGGLFTDHTRATISNLISSYVQQFLEPSYMKPRRANAVLVTGITGFVGRHIVRELRSNGIKVRCLARSSSSLSVLDGLDAEICYGDVTDQTSLETALQGVEAAVHLVAIIRETKQANFEGVNFLGTNNIVQTARKMGVKRLVYMSNLGAGPDQHFRKFLSGKRIFWDSYSRQQRS